MCEANGDFIKIYLCLVFLSKYDKDATPQDINTFLTTGSFPEYVKPAQEGAYVAPAAPVQPTYTAPVQAAPVYQAPVTPTPVAQPAYQAPVTPAPQATPVTPAPAAQPTATTERPARNFGGFSF